MYNIRYVITYHGLRTPREEKAFTARPKIHSHSQIFRYGRSIFCLPLRPNFSDIFDFCLHWVSVVRAHKYHRDKLVEQLSKSGNRNFWKPNLRQSAETCSGKLVKSHQVKLFWASFIRWKPRCGSAPPQADKWTGLSGIYATSLIKCHEDKLVEQVAKSISWLDTRQRQEETYFTFLSRMRHRH